MVAAVALHNPVSQLTEVPHTLLQLKPSYSRSIQTIVVDRLPSKGPVSVCPLHP